MVTGSTGKLQIGFITGMVFYTSSVILIGTNLLSAYYLLHRKRLISGYTQNFPEPIARIPES